MEVHHPNHPSHKKKWSEYIIEFLMLFLAVSLGFLAENIREGYVEKERAHELVTQLKSDIKKNIQLIDSIVLRNKYLVKELDTAVVYLSTNEYIEGDSLYKNLPPNVFRFLSKNDTYEQMKNSGSLRYIKDTVLLEKILRYASDCAAAEARSSSMEVDFVTGEYTTITNKWQPIEVATKGMYSQRSGEAVIVNRESTSELLIEPKEIEFLSKIMNLPKQRKFSKEVSDQYRAVFLPTIGRRTGLLINTVRFMGVAKESGTSLLDYIDKTEH